VTGILFDKSTFPSKVSEPYLTALNSAVDRWSQYIQINPVVVQSIRSAINPNFMGIGLNNYTISNLGANNYIAACGVQSYIDLSPGTLTVQFNSYSFNLFVNTYFAPGASPYFYTNTDWANLMTHELGHALGIGIFWSTSFQAQGSVPPANFFLNGAYYPGMSAAYSGFMGTSRPLIPLEDRGGGGTSSAHFENHYRPSSYTGANGQEYYGLLNELMVGFYSKTTNFLITNLSLSALTDFGYQEKNPGTNEGTPTLSTNSSLMPFIDIETSSGGNEASFVNYNCDCLDHSKPECDAIINTKTGEVLLSPIIVE
jgi:hypothetical protein